VLFEKLLGLKIITAISVTSLLFPIIWMTAKKRLKILVKEIRDDYLTNISRQANEVALFVVAGLLSVAVASTNADIVLSIFDYYGNSLPFNGLYVLPLAVFLFVGITSLLGMHPVLTVSILLPFLSPLNLGVPSEFVITMLVGAWYLATVISPFSALNLLLSGLSWRNSISSSISVQWRFVLAQAGVIYLVLIFMLQLS